MTKNNKSNKLEKTEAIDDSTDSEIDSGKEYKMVKQDENTSKQKPTNTIEAGKIRKEKTEA
jgi:hypothetical protein